MSDSSVGSSASLEMAQFACSLFGVPYKENGRSDSGIDCFGLLILSARHVGIEIPELNTVENVESLFKMVEEVTEDKLIPGDIVAYGSNGRTQHVAIFTCPNYKKIVHAVKRVGVTITALNELKKTNRIVGFYRLKAFQA